MSIPSVLAIATRWRLVTTNANRLKIKDQVIMQKKGFLKREIKESFCLQLHKIDFFSKRCSLVVTSNLFLFGPSLNSLFWFCESVKLVLDCPGFCTVQSLMMVDSCGLLQYDVSAYCFIPESSGYLPRMRFLHGWESYPWRRGEGAITSALCPDFKKWRQYHTETSSG